MRSNHDLARQITDSQQRIYGYIYSLTGNSTSSWDILQETNLVMWRKQGEVGEIRNFDAWAFTIARFQVMAHLRDRKRDPLMVMTPELVDQFSEDAEEVSMDMMDRLEALQKCKQRLGATSLNLLKLYYENGLNLREISERLDKNNNTLKQALHRVRRSLSDCIESLIPNSTT